MTDQTVVPGPEAPAPASAPKPKTAADYAQEVFGKEYFGKEESEEPKPVDTQAGEEPPPTEESTEGEKPEEGETAPQEDTGEIPIATLSELAEHLGTSVEYLNTIKVPVQVDGIPTEATVSDLIRSYQTTEAAEHRLEKAKALIQENAEAWNAKHAQYDQQFEVLGAMIQAEEAKLESDIRAIDPKLRDEDPAEWAARVQEFQGRRSQLAQLKYNAAAQWQANQNARMQEAFSQRGQLKAEQGQVLLNMIPEWRDPARANADKAKVQTYLINTEGFSPQELDQLLDARQVRVALKAMLYDESRGGVDAARKRVATVPKIMKSGAPKAREQIASERLAELHRTLVRTGHPDDALAYTLAKRGARK